MIACTAPRQYDAIFLEQIGEIILFLIIVIAR